MDYTVQSHGFEDNGLNSDCGPQAEARIPNGVNSWMHRREHSLST